MKSASSSGPIGWCAPSFIADRCLDVADALIQRVDRLVDHRQQDTVDDEGREILGYRDLLAELGDEGLGRVEGLVIGGDAADQLDQSISRTGFMK